jgi:hypothetical protein
MSLTQTQVSELYVAIFNRASEGEGNSFWQGIDDTAENIANQMLATDDAVTYFGTSLDTNQAFIEHIYLNTLSKTATDDPDGIAFWVAALDAGSSRGFIVSELVAAAQATENAGTAQDQFLNRVAVSDYTANTVSDAPADYATSLAFDGDLTVTEDASTVTSAQALVDDIAAEDVVVTNIALTTGQDSIEGTDGADMIIGIVDGADDTFTLGDVIQGGAGTDTVTVTTNQTNISLGDVTLQSIENFVLDARTTAIGDIEVLAADIESLDIDGNDREQTTDTEVTDILGSTSVSLHDVDYDGNDFELYYDETDEALNVSVTLTNVDDAQGYFDGDEADDGSSDSDVMSVTLDGVLNTDGSANFYGGDFETFNVTVASDSEIEYIGVYYNDDGTDFTGNVNLVLNGDLTVSDYWDLSDDDTTSVFTITGSGNLDIADLDDSDGDSQIAAGAATGNIEILDINDESTSVVTGSGDDVIGLEGSTTVTSVGAGDDKVSVGAALTLDTSGATDVVDASIDGGEGTDTFEISAANALTSETNIAASTDDVSVSDAFTNFEALSITSLSTQDIDATEWGLADDVTIDGYTTGGSLTVNDAASVTVTGAGTTDFAIVVDGADDTGSDDDSVTVTVDGTNGTALNDLTIADVETVNLVSNNDDADESENDVNTVDLIAADAVTLNISGEASASLTLGATTDLTAVETIDASTFDGGLTLDLATASAGEDVTVTTGAGADDIIGSDQNDTISVGDGGNTVEGGAGLDTITLGDGVTEDDVDSIVFTAVTDSQGVTVDVINGFQVEVQSTDDVNTDSVVDSNDVINDIIDLSAVEVGTGSYSGEANGYGAVLTSLAGGGDTQAVLDVSTSTLYVDVNGDAALDDNDMAIQLTGITDLSADNFVF